MAISKFTQPMRASAITPKPRINLGIVSQTLDRLSGQQREGEEARTKFQLLEQELLKNVIPGEENLARDIIQRQGLGIETMAQDADLINAGARIRAKTAELTSEFTPLAENAAVLADVRKRANEMTEKGDLTRANRFFAIEDALAQHKPGERFAPGILRKKIDIPKYIKENVTSFRNDKNELVELSDDGQWINTVTRDEVSPERVEAAVRLQIENNPEIRRQIAETERFELRQMDPDFINQQVRAQVDVLEAKRQEIMGDLSLSEEEKERQIGIIDDNQDELVEDPERFIVAAGVESRIDQLVAPQVLMKAGTQTSRKSTANPFAQILLRASLSSEGSGKTPLTLTGGEIQVNAGGFDPARNAMENINADEAMIEVLDNEIGQTDGIRKQRLIRQKDTILQDLGRKLHMKNQILQENGVTEEQYDAILVSQTNPADFDLTKQRAAVLDSTKEALDGSAFIEWSQTLTPKENAYLQEKADWKNDLDDEAKNIIRIVDRGVKARPKSTAAKAVTPTATQEKNLLRNANGLENVGKIVVNVKTGKQVTENFPEFTGVSSMNTIPINGLYSGVFQDKDNESYVFSYTDTQGIGSYLARNMEGASIMGRPISDVQFAAEVLGLPEGEAMPVFFNGVNVLGDGNLLDLRDGIYTIINGATGEIVEGGVEETNQTDVIGMIQQLASQR